MSRKNMLMGCSLAALVLFAVSAVAATKGPLELQHPTNVAGKQLASGEYTVQWDGSGDQVELKIFQGKKEVATTSARVVKVDRAPGNNSAVTMTNGDGSSSLTEIRFRGKTYALQLSGEGAGAGASGAAR